MSAARDKGPDLDLSQVPADQLEFLPSPTPATPDDIRWARMAEESRFNGLPDIQRSAERWGATILVITGLLTTLTAVQGASNLDSLRDLWPYKVMVGILAGSALLLAVGSVIWAAMAAQGQSVSIVVSAPRFAEETAKATRVANDRLKTSRRLALAIVPFYLATLGVMAYAPQKGDEPPNITVTDNVGGTYCGLFVKQQKNVLVIVGEKGVVARVPSVNITSIKPTSKCSSKK
ncbi:hypothetical protein [Streptomyces pakalii]|uniref:Uncharacterized protein n=1 Tax=Streptomyces pakalii TaxID=3036494 RepID=A0ABT7DE57_9ACTN|nr:hypothetical protein [Streptomyces pakalii]MDJ1644101.1 hypothetical protein [Streptomyces pakalii]